MPSPTTPSKPQMPSKPMAQGNKIHFTSLGCSRNLVDSEVMLGLLLQRGYEVAQDVQEADFIIVNTCGFLDESRRESLDTIDLLLGEKKQTAKLIVTGCMVQKHSHLLEGMKSKIHYLLGSGDVEKIIDAVEADQDGSSITTARSYLEWGEIPRQISTPKHYAYLKIAEGCAKRCAFCIIPNIKGPLKSKAVERVLKEFKTLLASGVQEVILIAQDLGDYGKERREANALENLLKEMLKVEGKYWIRLLYLYPDEISDALIELIQSDSRICPYIDMPIQHISDSILKAMKRKTNGAQIKETITKLREKVPGIVIRTSLMVGFPGETDENFAELVSFIKEFPLDNIGIFKYSKEEESASASYPDHISEEVKQRRFELLAKTQAKILNKTLRKYLGKTLEVIVEGYHPETELLLKGRFYGQCPEIDGMVIINDPRGVNGFGQRYQVKITDIAGYDLIGSVVAKTSKSSPNALKLAIG